MTRVLLKDIIQKNPQIDPDQLKEGLRLNKKLRESGMQERGYELVPNFSEERVQTFNDEEVHPRTVHICVF